MSRPSISSCLATVSLAVALAPGAAAADAPPAGAIRIESITTSGSGCPTGSVSTAVAPDSTAFSLLFSSFTAAVGPDAAGEPSRRACKVHVKLAVPKDWAYAIEAVDFRGFAYLEPGVKAVQRSRFQIAPGPREAGATMSLAGELYEDFVVNAVVGDPLRSPCGKGKQLIIRTDVELDNRAAPAASGELTIDSADGVVEQTYRLRWNRCR